MRRRVRGLLAIVIASAALAGALAGPASAAQPQFSYFYTCSVQGTSISIGATAPADVAHKAISDGRQICDPGTLSYSIGKV